jgi:tetratricopeptide (TPR) repeat protein
MSTCPSWSELQHLLREELEATENERIADHVSSCTICQAALDRLTDNDLLSGMQTPCMKETSLETDPTLADLISCMKQRSAGDLAPLRSPEDSASDTVTFPGSATDDAALGQLGPYQIKQEFGSGSTGRLFQAYDPRLRRTVAVKVLKRELATLESARVRFEREARAAAALDHENVVRIYEVGDLPDFPPYLVLEFIDGESLGRKLEREGTIQPRLAAEIVRQIADGLSAAHQQDVIHRDIKPSNIMIEASTSRVKIADFGLARVQESKTGITLAGILVGTPDYMSPEQIVSPSTSDNRSDVYSLGVVLYEMLTGECPFRGVLRMVLFQVLNNEPEAPRRLNDQIPRDLETVCLKAMAKEPRHRYQSAASMAEDLTCWLEGKPVDARPLGFAGRFLRWIKRSPRMAVLASLVVSLLVTGAVGWAFFTFSLSDARNRADRNAHAARQQRDLAIKSLQAMIFEVQNTLQDEPRTQDLRKALLEIALSGLAEISTSGDESELETLNTVIARNRMGDVAREMGKTEEARRQFQAALKTAKNLRERLPDEAKVQHALVFTLWNLGDINLKEGQHSLAENRYEEALHLSREVFERDPESMIAKRSLSIAYERMGDFFRDRGRLKESQKHYQLSIEMARALAKDAVDDRELKRDLGVTCLKQGAIGLTLGDTHSSVSYIEEGYELLWELTKHSPGNLRAQRDFAIACTRKAELAEQQNHPAVAAEFIRRSLEIFLVLSQKEPNSPLRTRDLAETARPRWEKLTRLSSARFEDHQGLITSHKNMAIAEFLSGETARANRRITQIRTLLAELPQGETIIMDVSRKKWVELRQKELERLEDQGNLTP